MTDEIMPREDRSGKVWAFLGGCLAGVVGLFAVAMMSEMSSSTTSSDDSGNGGEQDETLALPEGSSNSGN